MKFNQHIESKNRLGLRNLGMIRRNLLGSNKSAKLIAYNTLCLPHLQFACQVWDPTLRKDVDLLESTQRKAVRFIGNLHGRESVTEEMKKLGIMPLEERRRGEDVKVE